MRLKDDDWERGVNKVGATSGRVVAVLSMAISVVTFTAVEKSWESDGSEMNEPGEVLSRVLTTRTRSDDGATASLLVTSGTWKVVCSDDSGSELTVVEGCRISESPEKSLPV